MPVQYGAHFLCADDHDFLRGAGEDVLAGDIEGVDEAGAGGRDIEAGGIDEAELRLDKAGGGGHRGIRRDGGDDEEVDLLGVHASVFERSLSRLGRHVGTGFISGGDMAFTDARAGGDPFVIGVDNLRQVVVGEDFLGNPCADSGDDG